MEEPSRIGLTKETNAFLDKILEDVNPAPGQKGTKLIKFDLIRLAVALGVKHNKKITSNSINTDNAFRRTELDPDKALYYVVQASDIPDNSEPIYKCIERLADQGIREMYKLYRDNLESFDQTLKQLLE